MKVDDYHESLRSLFRVYPLSDDDVRLLTSGDDINTHNISVFGMFEISSPVFFRISTISGKDISTFASTKEEILYVLTRSNRIQEDLELYSPQSLILRDWDERITPSKEYRCIIVDGILEMTISSSSGEIVNLEPIDAYVASIKDRLPCNDVCLDVCLDGEEVIFIEFNVLDSELDMYGADWNKLSERGRILVNT